MLYGSDEDNALTERIIGCAIEIHRVLGPGLLESVYELALTRELRDAGLSFQRQVAAPVYYKGESIAAHRPDLVVAGRVVVEVKSVSRLEPVHTAQLLTYLQILQLRVGLLLNFNVAVMKHGIRRFMR
jgi:GxxExxY protein